MKEEAYPKAWVKAVDASGAPEGEVESLAGASNGKTEASGMAEGETESFCWSGCRWRSAVGRERWRAWLLGFLSGYAENRGAK